mgnify:FL=1
MKVTTFRLFIDTTNDAFGDTSVTRARETARLLHDIAGRIEAGAGWEWHHTIRDINGNDVGCAEFVHD